MDGNLHTAGKTEVDAPLSRLFGGMDDETFQAWKKGDLEIEIEGLNQGVLDPASASKKALEVHKRIVDTMDEVFNRKRDVGFSVKRRKGYMGRQVHDAATIDSMKTTDWIALVKKTFKFTGVEEVELDKMLGESYANFSDMTSTYFGAEGKVDATGKKFEMGRDWEFSSPEAAVNYRKIMGGKTLMDNIVSDLQRDGREVAAARMFGPNYQQGFDDFMQAAKKYAKKQGPKELKKFKAEEGAMQRYYESDVKGSRYFGDGVVANVSRKMRQFADMKLLSNSLVTTLTDLSLSAGVLSSTTGKNYWTTLARVIKHQFSLFTSPAKRRDAAALMQVMMEDTMFDTTAGRTEIIGVGNSIMDRLHKNYMKIGGLPAQSASARLGNAEIMSLDLAQSSHLSFDQLYSGTRERFNNFGITSKDWEVMRNSVIELPDGSRRNMPPSLEK